MTWIKSFAYIKNFPRVNTALSMLERMASLVKSIMRARGWVLPVLSERFPSIPRLLGMHILLWRPVYISLVDRKEHASPYLLSSLCRLMILGINHRQKIPPFLRPHWTPDTFLSKESVVGTMLLEASCIHALGARDGHYGQLVHNLHGPHNEHFYKVQLLFYIASTSTDAP